MKIITRFISLFVICALWGNIAQAQQGKKPQIVVYGSDIEAFSAAVQAAQSSVPTVWVTPNQELVVSLTTEQSRVEGNNNLDGGVWMELLMKIARSKIPNDSIASHVKNRINPQLMANAIEKIIAEQENLTIIRNQRVVGLKRNRRNWDVQLENKVRFRVRSVVDASEQQELNVFLDSPITEVDGPRLIEHLSSSENRIRVANGTVNGKLYAATSNNIFMSESDGLFNLSALQSIDKNLNSSPFRSAYSQAVGAAAAYCAFFKTTSEKIDVRLLQTELLTYGARLSPFQDVVVSDPNYSAIQKFGLVNMLPGKMEDSVYLLGREDSVTYAEIEPVLGKMHARSKLWFLENQGDIVRWKDLISLIKFVSFKGDEVDRQIQKDWQSRFKFEGDFDLENVVTRYQFAVIVDFYANPYTIKINREGDILR